MIKRIVHRKGFTLIELMLVVIIIGILVAMIVPRMAGRSEQARVAVSQADVDLNIATALKLYELDNGSFPTTDEGLNALLSAPSTAKRWKGPYLDKAPVDPWNNPYKYRSPGTHRTDYDLYSLGKDGTESSDDVTNWQQQQ
ncbi:MAG: type II secretion system major pseudopilin GspG [Candidatus Omnitrophica bacterium]|nr:type II secretion system major pseudopilin GspG [Candidatus Omnitrophota bacterium]